jgi:hypothetical protein
MASRRWLRARQARADKEAEHPAVVLAAADPTFVNAKTDAFGALEALYAGASAARDHRGA